MVEKSLYNPKVTYRFFYNDMNGKKCELLKPDGKKYTPEEAKDVIKKLGVRKKNLPVRMN